MAQNITKVWLRNLLNELVNPSTEEKQDDIISGLDDLSIAKANGVVSTKNSTTTPLGIDAVFTGVSEEVKDYGAIGIAIYSDKDSLTDGVCFEFSQDGTNWDDSECFCVLAGVARHIEFGIRARYFRIKYTNGGTDQSAFRVQTILRPMRTQMAQKPINVDLIHCDFAATRRAILAARKPNGDYVNINATAGGNLKMALEETEGNAAVGDGTSLVTTAGTRVQLPDVACKRVFIQALDDNVGTVVIGGATVVAAVGTRQGMALYGSQGQWFNVSNINLLYIDSTSNGDTINYYYEN